MIRIINKIKKLLSAATVPISNSKLKQVCISLDKRIQRNFVVFIGHADYKVSCGGTQKYQLDDLSALNRIGYDVIQLYPIPYNNGKLFGVNYNNASLVSGLNINQVREFIGFLKDSDKFFSFNVHHLLDWDEGFIEWFTASVAGHRVLVYLHDFYTICPSKFLFYNDEKYCGYIENPEDVSRCGTCCYGMKLQKWRQSFSALFDVADYVICPSTVLMDTVASVYRIDNDKIYVCEHLKTSETEQVKNNKISGKIKVAYLGYKSDWKGWRIFEKFYSENDLKKIYDFYHVGSDFNFKGPTLTNISYSFLDNSHAAVDALIDNQIDLVLLLSVVPESYSFTLHEAYAACVPVLAFECSGNISSKIKASQIYGRVFRNADELHGFLANRNAVSSFIEANPKNHISSLEHNSAFLNLFGKGDF